METTILGRTKLEVTTAGLGCGGHSRLGIEKYGAEHAAGIARAAFDAGVNFFDTAAIYGTEAALGSALDGISRDKYVLSSKFWFGHLDWRTRGAELLMETLEQCLRNLKSDYVDIYHLHGVKASDYPDACDVFLPVLHKAREQGKIRFIGITEQFVNDTAHEMLQKAIADNHFDVIMTGYNMLNHSAARTVLPAATEREIGILCMFAVRTALSNPQCLAEYIGRIIENGQGGAGLERSENALDFLTETGAAGSIMEAAYRFCWHTPGIDVILTGTGNAEHLKTNLRSISMPPLPDEILQTLHSLFGMVDCVSGD